MRERSRRAYARRLLARMHSWPPARKSWARCKLQTHQPQLTEYDCEETLEHKVSYTHARRFGTRCMVPWTHLREPMWENEDERKSEFTHFNLVIRLHKVQQLALHLSAILSCRWYVAPGSSNSAQVPLFWTARNNVFYSERATAHFGSLHYRLRLHAFRCGLLSFDGFLVRLNISCT